MEQHIKYPLGIQSFEKLRKEGALYVDKTALIHTLVNSLNYVFLSRPRRFGKSLLQSTIEAYFLGKRELFEGLAIEQLEKDWTSHPVLHIDLSGERYSSPLRLLQQISDKLSEWECIYGGDSTLSISLRFKNIIRNAALSAGRGVVVLIDEYDKPLLDNLNNRELHSEITEELMSFYSVIKKSDAYIRFVMITGVSRFGQLSIFSGLNNLTDITLNREFNAICGITESEFHHYFRDSIRKYADSHGFCEEDTWQLFKDCYDGYHFCADGEDIYNPLSVLTAFAQNECSNFWYGTGTPSFLIRLLHTRHYRLCNLDNAERTASQLLDITDAESDIVPLLFQAGYLTIKGSVPGDRRYILGYPNREVAEGFAESLSKEFFPACFADNHFSTHRFADDLESGNAEDFMLRLKSLLATVSNEYEPDKEIHFQNSIYIIAHMLGFSVRKELHFSMGRADMTISTPRYIYLFEFKIDSDPQTAMSQIENKRYIEPYLIDPREKIMIGADFSTTTRNLSGWEIRRCQ